MRELILKMSISLDGFVSDLDGTNQWIYGSDPEAKAWAVATTWNASLHIMGSRTFEGMARFWPTSTNVFAPAMNQIPKAVFSKKGAAILPQAIETPVAGEPQPGADSWHTAYVASGDLAEEIARLKAKDGKPIIAHGGATFARSLIAHDLVDQYMLMVYPLALGRGQPIFSDLAQPRQLQLVSTRVFPKGAIAQVYRRG